MEAVWNDNAAENSGDEGSDVDSDAASMRDVAVVKAGKLRPLSHRLPLPSCLSAPDNNSNRRFSLVGGAAMEEDAVGAASGFTSKAEAIAKSQAAARAYVETLLFPPARGGDFALLDSLAAFKPGTSAGVLPLELAPSSDDAGDDSGGAICVPRRLLYDAIDGELAGLAAAHVATLSHWASLRVGGGGQGGAASSGAVDAAASALAPRLRAALRAAADEMVMAVALSDEGAVAEAHVDALVRSDAARSAAELALNGRQPLRLEQRPHDQLYPPPPTHSYTSLSLPRSRAAL